MYSVFWLVSLCVKVFFTRHVILGQVVQTFGFGTLSVYVYTQIAKGNNICSIEALGYLKSIFFVGFVWWVFIVFNFLSPLMFYLRFRVDSGLDVSLTAYDLFRLRSMVSKTCSQRIRISMRVTVQEFHSFNCCSAARRTTGLLGQYILSVYAL